MAPATREKGWWHAYDDVIPAGFDLYLGLEQVASSLSIYQQELIPGLLQTPDYVRAMRHTLTENEIEQSIAIKRQRQTSITRQVAPMALNVVLNEAILRRAVGGPRAMSAQLKYFAQLSELPNVNIRIIPFEVGFHPGMLTGPFVVLHFLENGIGNEVEPPAVYIEGATGELWLDREHEVGTYEDIFANILVAAADKNGYTSRDMLWRASMEVQ